MEKSYFDGGLIELVIISIFGTLITVITLGIAFPWALCMVYNWEVRHTVVDGKRMYFDGNAVQLFANWIKWLVLTIITFGIYSFWLRIKLKQWITKHTHFR